MALNGYYQALDLNLGENQRDLVTFAQQMNGKVNDIATLSMLQVMAHGDTKNPKRYDYYNEPRTNLYGSLQTTVDDTILDFVVDSAFAENVKPNFVLLIEGEQLIVESVNTTTNTITVKARGDAGTSNTAHTTPARMDIIGKTEGDGTITQDFVLSSRINYINYFQEFTNTVNLTKRAIKSSNKDRADLMQEEEIATMWKHLQIINKALNYSNGFYDATGGNHTIKGISQLITDGGGVTQASLGYTSGAFDINDWNALMQEMASRSSDAKIIQCNASTKQKLISLIPDKEYRNQVQGNEAQTAGIAYDGIVASARDNRILTFLIDNTILPNEFRLLDLDDMPMIPGVDENGSDEMYSVSEEPETSALFSETIRSVSSLKMNYPDMMAVCENI